MPSSTSSSDHRALFDRPLPSAPLGTAAVVALVLCLAGVLGWELLWRATTASPAIRNSAGLWARERRRIDGADSTATVLIGSSRMLSDIQLDVWEHTTGHRPIQLSLEGTASVWPLENLAADPHFKGCLLVGVTPPLFFTGFEFRKSVFEHYPKETLAERAGQWLSMHLVEPFFAFYDPDFALLTVAQRQGWPERQGAHWRMDVRRLFEGGPDRNNRVWHRLETDTAYSGLATRIWAQSFAPPPGVTPAMAAATRDRQIERSAKAVATLRARGVPVIFVRHPAFGPMLDVEHKAFPRDSTWEPLLARSGAPGIHFEDHAELQGYRLPEWSHLAATEADRYTAAFIPILQQVAPAGACR
jgi:hypothetical protein